MSNAYAYIEPVCDTFDLMQMSNEELGELIASCSLVLRSRGVDPADVSEFGDLTEDVTQFEVADWPVDIPTVLDDMLLDNIIELDEMEMMDEYVELCELCREGVKQ